MGAVGTWEAEGPVFGKHLFTKSRIRRRGVDCMLQLSQEQNSGFIGVC